MYEKKPAYKHTYKCMKKTRMQMYEKNTYKHAYKCMKKTRIQMYEKNMRVEMFLGRSHDTALVVCSAEGGGRKG